jgi:hypothetical protein
VSWAEGSRSAVRTAVWEHGAGSTLCPERMRRGYMASSSLCVDDLTAEPPAHCRLYPTTICFKIVVYQQFYPSFPPGTAVSAGENTTTQTLPVVIPLERQRASTFPRSRQDLSSAHGRARQRVETGGAGGHLAALDGCGKGRGTLFGAPNLLLFLQRDGRCNAAVWRF